MVSIKYIMEQESDIDIGCYVKDTKYKKKLRGTTREIEYCDVCKKNRMYAQCNKCGDSVCNSDGDCCVIFPHYYNTEFIICNFCMTEADKKIKPYIEELQTLKRNIKNNKTYTRDSSSDSNDSSYSDKI